MLQSTRWKKQMWSALKLVAPGTVLREGIDNVLRAKTGGLIVLSDSPEVRNICQGGFHIEEELTPARLYELAKMDGAIILDEKCKNIWRANVQIHPVSNEDVQETGIRHRIAARTALETDAVVVAISQRRSMITLYKGADRFIFDESVDLVSKASQALRTLESYCEELNKELMILTALEFDDNVLVSDVVKTVQRCEMVRRIEEALDFYLLQMGEDGFLLEMQKKEMSRNFEDSYHDILLDYISSSDKRTVSAIEKKIASMDESDLNDSIYLGKTLGFGAGNELLDLQVHPCGYRILDNVPRLPSQTIGKIIEFFDGNFLDICDATLEQFDEVEGIGRVRANMIFRSLIRQKNNAFRVIEHN